MEREEQSKIIIKCQSNAKFQFLSKSAINVEHEICLILKKTILPSSQSQRSEMEHTLFIGIKATLRETQNFSHKNHNNNKLEFYNR